MPMIATTTATSIRVKPVLADGVWHVGGVVFLHSNALLLHLTPAGREVVSGMRLSVSASPRVSMSLFLLSGDHGVGALVYWRRTMMLVVPSATAMS